MLRETLQALGRLSRRSFGAAGLAMLLGAAQCTTGEQPAEAKQLLLLQNTVDARTQAILRNLDHLLRQPFDGYVVNIPASWNFLQPGVKLRYAEVHDSWLKPLKGPFNSRKNNFLLAIVREHADPFDSWTATIANWLVLAKAARDSGFKGIFFDNEEYFEQLWDWPRDVKYRHQSLAAYQARYRARGRELMQALLATWPEVQVIHAHGPYISEARTPRQVSLLQTETRPDHLSGHFFSGMLEVSKARHQVVDGGMLYQYRSAADFAGSWQWRRTGLPAVAPASLIPDALRASWAQRSSIGFGVYDRQWKPGYPMNPAILQTTLTNALARADRYVWLFAESDGPRNFLVPGGAGSDWTRAIARARATSP